jgi:hypothetical protein
VVVYVVAFIIIALILVRSAGRDGRLSRMMAALRVAGDD